MEKQKSLKLFKLMTQNKIALFLDSYKEIYNKTDFEEYCHKK